MPETHPTPQTLAEFLKGPPRISQRRLAVRCRLAQSYISMIVRRQRVPRPEVLARISRVTHIPVDKLVSYVLRGKRR